MYHQLPFHFYRSILMAFPVEGQGVEYSDRNMSLAWVLRLGGERALRQPYVASGNEATHHTGHRNVAAHVDRMLGNGSIRTARPSDRGSNVVGAGQTSPRGV